MKRMGETSDIVSPELFNLPSETYSMTIPFLHILIYSFTLWFGLYLVARDKNKLGLRYAGLGLISYAFALALSLLLRDTIENTAWGYLPIMLPSVFWMLATIYLVPEVPIERINTHIIFGMILIILLTFSSAIISPDHTRWIALALPISFLLGAVIRSWQILKSESPRPPIAILLTASVFFALASALIILPLSWLAQDWVVLAISLDLLCLGYVVGVLDAYDEGTRLFEDALRSLAAASLGIIIFGGQVVMVMAITDNTSAPMLTLLFGLITTLLVTLVFYDDIQSLLDGLIFSNRDNLRQQRDSLRAASSGLARKASSHPFENIDEKEFARLTRRALSHYSDLNKLSASPLLQLEILEERIEDDNVLARANALKSLLRESIEQLKPEPDVDFAPNDEWRYYNVLYFPYIVGLKPYSRRFFGDDLDATEADALEWFRTYVPERTLYNWQKTAAELIAQNLREKLS